MVRFVLGLLGPGFVLCYLSLACGPTASSTAPTPPADAFAVVRATSQAAYQAGTAALDRGDYLQACVYLDTAKTNDPDNRPEIQQALEQALSRCLTPPPEPTAAQASAQQRTIVVATVVAGASTALATGATITPAAAAQTALAGLAQATPTAPTATPAVQAATSTRAAAGTSTTAAAGTSTDAAAAGNASPTALVQWNDPQGRFSIGAPADWARADQPAALVGTGVVGFHDTRGRAEADVAVDAATHAVSPELYAASLELAMQQQVPGYASEQIVPGTTAGTPSVRRVFTFMQRDASGQDHQARGFQVTIVKGSTPYIISGSAPAEQYEQYSATFDRIVGSFRFS